MDKFYSKKNLKIVLFAIVILSLFLLGYFYNKTYRDNNESSLNQVSLVAPLFANKDNVVHEAQKSTENTGVEKNDLDMPILQLPLRYFTDGSVAWGSSVNTSRNSDDKNTWKYAAVDGGDAYQSFPTKTITLSTDDFSNDIEQLPQTKSMEQILKQDIEEDTPWQWLYKDQIKEYGDLATRFLPGERIDVKKFDVDKDGKNETIIFLCGVGGNHCPHRIIILKDQKTIFTISAGLIGLDISKTETGDGFYVHWVPTGGKWDQGLCCPLGYVKTRFVYDKGKFLPVYEQEVLYFEIENID